MYSRQTVQASLLRGSFQGLLVLFVLALGLLSACTNEKTASKANFKKAIQAYYDTLPGACATPPAGEVPFRVVPDGFIRTTRQARADAMVSAGLLIRVAAPPRNQHDPDTEFRLTSTGSKALVKGAGTNAGPGDAFCTGRYRVHDIVNFTEPGEMMGTRVSHVTHTYTLEGAADWSRNPALQELYPELRDGHDKERRTDTMMVLRNDGWFDTRAKGM